MKRSERDTLERACLAAILLKPENITLAQSVGVGKSSFRRERHRLIYSALWTLGQLVPDWGLRELQLLLDFAGRFEQVGGFSYLAGLDIDLPDLGRAEHYFATLLEAGAEDGGSTEAEP